MKNIYLLLIVITCYSCAVFRNSNNQIILDKWYTVDAGQDDIMFKSDGTFLFLPSSFDESGIDTLSYGTWKVDNDFIEITSDSKFFNRIFDAEVKESFSDSKDSIYVYVEDADVGSWDAVETYPYLVFEVGFTTTDKKNRFENYFHSDVIKDMAKIHVFDSLNFPEIKIQIYPNIRNYPRKINTEYAHVFSFKRASNSVNTFHVKILDFDYKYFAYNRFNKEYIKIVNQDTLLWDGVKCYRRNVKN